MTDFVDVTAGMSRINSVLVCARARTLEDGRRLYVAVSAYLEGQLRIQVWSDRWAGDEEPPILYEL